MSSNHISFSCKLLFIIVLLAVFTASQLYALNSSFEVIRTGDNFTEIEFNLPDIELIPVEIDGIEYHRLFHHEAGVIGEKGLPELLSFSTVLSIPDIGQVHADDPQILNNDIIPDVNIIPFQNLDLEIDKKAGFLKDETFYSEDILHRNQLVQIGTPAIMRDDRLINITINPFSYNPSRNELQITDRLTVRIEYDTSVNGMNELIVQRPRSYAFHEILKGSVINYGQFRSPGARDAFQLPHILMIHHDSATYATIVDQIASWKRDKGFKVTVTDTDNMSTLTAITNYIRNAYNNWDNRPEYVLLIGSFAQVPTSTVHTESGDHPYTLLDGDDLLPDVILGRIAASSNTDLATVWNKIRNHERTPYMTNTAWYDNALLIGDRYASSHNIVKYIRVLMEGYNDQRTFREHINTSGSAQNFSTEINQGINAGSSFFMYRGYLGMSSWSPSDAALNNGYKLFNGTFITCGTLNTSTGGNAVSIVNMGSPTVAKGAVTTMGMFTGGTNTSQNNSIQAGVFYGIFVEDLRTMGQAMVRAKLNVWRSYSNLLSYHNSMSNHLHWLNLIGDPSMNTWAGVPKVLEVDYPEELPQGSNSINFVVTDENDEPIEDAWLTIRKGDDYILSSGFTDITGSITHFFHPDSTGTINVTVTKPDYKPHIGSFDVDEDMHIVSFHEIIAETDFIAGTEIDFDLSIKNHLDQLVSDVEALISTESEYINITTSNASFGNIASGDDVESATSYSIQIAPDTPSNYQALFDLTVTDDDDNNWLSRFAIPIHNADLILTELIIDDGDNGILEPGEQAYLMFHITNEGQLGLNDVYGELTGESSGFSIINDIGFFGDIMVDDTITSSDEHIRVSLSSYVIPGVKYEVELHLYNEDGFSQRITHEIEVGIVTVTDPLGPDAYGYWVFDEGDIDYVDVPVYDWIEIAPDNDGDGVNTGLNADHNNNQQTMTMDLPFTFTFYGIDYDVVSICANGWISFGEKEEATQHNRRLPGPNAPQPVVAVFWDNLSLGSGDVFTWYDEDNHLFVIQWENARNIVNNREETFQVILYNPRYYPTLTLDGPIKMQYKVFNNVNNSSGSPHGEWGNHATIGIADHTGKVGLEYTYCNMYPTAALPLGDESAIYFTTGLSAVYVAVENYSFTGMNRNHPQFGETGDINMTLVNIGIEDGENVSTRLSTEDDYVTILQDEAYFGDIDSEQQITVDNAYTISIADNVPHNHRAAFTLIVNEGEDSQWEHTFFMTMHAPRLNHLNALIDDPEPNGNNNGLIDPGEKLTVFIPITNEGGATSPYTELNITNENDIVEILDISETTFESFTPSETFYPAITIEVDDNAESGDILIFSYTLTTGNYIFEGEVILGVGGLIPVQLGSGDSVNETQEPCPINIYFLSTRTQTVYTADELENAGLTRGLPMPINQIGYYVDGSPENSLPNFIVRMKHTTATDARAHDNGPFTEVLSMDTYNPVENRWDMLSLDNQFVWNGVDNILIDTAFAPVQGWSRSGQVKIYTQKNGFRYTQDDTDQTNATTEDVSKDKPQITLTMGTDPDIAIHKPRNLRYSIVGQNVRFEWEAPPRRRNSDNIRSRRNQDARSSLGQEYRNPEGYNIYRNGKRINSDLITSTQYLDDSFETGRINYFYVIAVYEERDTLPSNVVSFNLEYLPNPNMYPEAGIYYEPIEIILETDIEDAQIYYTLNGSKPTRNDFLYEEPFEIDWHKQVRARVYKDGSLSSNITSADYHILYSPEDIGVDVSDNTITVSWDEPWSPQQQRNQINTQNRSRVKDRVRQSDLLRSLIGYNIYRYIDDNNPQKLNDEPIEGNEYVDTDLATGIYEYYVTSIYDLGESKPSEIVTAYVGITAPPVFSPKPGEYNRPVQVSITSATTGAAIYYTLNGSEPNEESSEFTDGTIRINTNTTIQAIAICDELGESDISVGVYVFDSVSVEDETTPILTTELFSAYPNPFNPETTVRFNLKESSQVSLEIYNILGQRIKTIVDNHLETGKYQYVWHGDDNSGNRVSSGIYFYRLNATDYVAIKKVIMLK